MARQRPTENQGDDDDAEDDNPLWSLFGVWGRVLVVFGVIGHVLAAGALAVGWPLHKFLVHVLGAGLLLLFSRPRYSPALSSRLASGMSPRELQDVRLAVDAKLGLAHRVPSARRRERATDWGPLGRVFAWAMG